MDKIKKGEWDRGFCSVCGKRSLIILQNGEIAGIDHTPFCKNCGAKMVKVIIGRDIRK